MTAAVVLVGITLGSGVIAVVCILFLLSAGVAYYLATDIETPALSRSTDNPLMSPSKGHYWESEAVFNPGAFVYNGKVHLFYRAMGTDGISRIGYAVSEDGVHFDRLPDPVFDRGAGFLLSKGKRVYAPLSYDTTTHPSGGGWGGCEDPRVLIMDNKVYMHFIAFEGWHSIRTALTSLSLADFNAGIWNWSEPLFLSPPDETQKNWVLFPEKIGGKYAILHSIAPYIQIAFVDDLKTFDGTHFIQGSSRSGGRPQHWDKMVRGAGAPPLRTEKGWLLLYHAMNPEEPSVGYKVGAMLLDLEDPTKVLYRSNTPILEAQEWYEHDAKPNVVYASGAVIFGEDLIVYYGGGDKHVGAARTPLTLFLQALTLPENAVEI